MAKKEKWEKSLKMKEGRGHKEVHEALESPEGTELCPHLDFIPRRPTVDF